MRVLYFSKVTTQQNCDNGCENPEDSSANDISSAMYFSTGWSKIHETHLTLRKKDCKNVNFAKNEILELRILRKMISGKCEFWQKMRFWNCEFSDKWVLENANFYENWDFSKCNFDHIAQIMSNFSVSFILGKAVIHRIRVNCGQK